MTAGYLFSETAPADTTQIVVESGTILVFWGTLARLLQRDAQLALSSTTYSIYSIEPSLITITLDVNPSHDNQESASLPIGVCLSLLSNLHTTWLRSNTHRVKTWLQPWRGQSNVVDATWSFVREIEKEMRIEEIREDRPSNLPLPTSFFETPNADRAFL
jgi:hypothetical protein